MGLRSLALCSWHCTRAGFLSDKHEKQTWEIRVLSLFGRTAVREITHKAVCSWDCVWSAYCWGCVWSVVVGLCLGYGTACVECVRGTNVVWRGTALECVVETVWYACETAFGVWSVFVGLRSEYISSGNVSRTVGGCAS